MDSADAKSDFSCTQRRFAIAYFYCENAVHLWYNSHWTSCIFIDKEADRWIECTLIQGQTDNASHWWLVRQVYSDLCYRGGFTLTMSRFCLCRSWYFCLHITCILVVMVLPVKSRRRQTKEQQDKQSEHNSTDNNCNQKDKATWGWGTGAPLGRGNTWDELTWELECGQIKWKVFTWPRTKKKRKKIGRSEKSQQAEKSMTCQHFQ